ncbi:GrpB family protein [Bacteriovorax sp. Seq25_V]|uniref:GrpB family protein n=1 Tax=Bacteriovorax sp. Seq25_V TaxID=1201288 RepID=UPI000389FEF5|nr:GrpB family protein [Bacteriovorax sp. Seq25_V]EQC47437.1 hypothetical protein M900_0978 [Bacteriovorax sp. Seq25_V]
MIEFVDYDPIWTKIFEKEMQSLMKLLKSNLIQCHHIGSTAIPSIKAVPCMDILCIVHTLDGISIFQNEFKKAGFSIQDSNDEKRINFYRHGASSSNILTKVTILEGTNEMALDMIDFKEYLNAEPEVAKEYERMKLAHKGPIEIYEQSKKLFIQTVLKTINS